MIAGRLSEEKGVIAAVEALLQLVSATAGLHLLILGDGEERQRLERLVKHAGMTDRVVFLGFQQSLQERLGAMARQRALLFDASDLNDRFIALTLELSSGHAAWESRRPHFLQLKIQAPGAVSLQIQSDICIPRGF